MYIFWNSSIYKPSIHVAMFNTVQENPEKEHEQAYSEWVRY